MDALLFPVYVLQGASCYLVALIVLLRLLSLKQTSGTTLERLSNVISISIWITLLLISSIGFGLSFVHHKTFVIYRGIAFHIFFSLPILSTIIMYGVLLYKLKQETRTISTQLRDLRIDTSTDNIYTSTAKLTKGVVICMLVCNVPFILWMQYLGVKYQKGGLSFAANVFSTKFGV